MKHAVGLGLDFGTTNSSIGMVDQSGEVTLAKFEYTVG